MSLNDFADTLVRQTWQVALVFGLVWAFSTFLRRASAHCRYMLWLLVIAKCVTPPIVNVPIALLTFNARVASQSAAPQTVVGKPMEADRAAIELQAPASSDVTLDQSEPPLAAVRTTPHTFSQRFTPRFWLVTTWMLVAATMLTFVAVRFWATNRRLTRLRMPADDETRKMIGTLARRLGITHPPKIYASAGTAQPFVCGLVRGDIYVPPGFVNYGTKEQRQAVLTHELAHVARCDAALNLVQIVVQSLFFFHPLVWWANRRIRQEREKCCDEIVLSVTRTEPEPYCRAIVEILASGSRQTRFVPVLAVTGSIKDIHDRIVTILTPGRKFHRRPSRMAAAMILLVGTCVLPTGLVLTSRPQALAAADPPAQNKAAASESKSESKLEATVQEKSATASTPSTWEPGQTMEFRAIDARTREPIPGVTLELQNLGQGIDFQDVKTQTTDADGLSIVKFPDLPAKEVRIYPSKTGYVPLRLFWGGEPHAILPKTLTIPMEPGKEFGGILRNKAGKPIPNATVTIHYWAKGTGQNPHIRANINEQTTSDADGRWRLNIMPAEVSATELRIYVKHPDYLSDHLSRGFLPFPVIEQPPLEKLFDQTAVMVMADGEIIEGKVISSETRLPIPGAKVFLSDIPREPLATSDEEGRFKMTGISRTTENGLTRNSNYPLALIVQAAGHAPELMEVKQTSGPMEIRLNRAKSVRGKVVDEAGAPIEGAGISADQWRGRRNQLALNAKSAADGTFTVADAPADVVKYTIYKEGYLATEHVDMSPSREHSITLKPVVQIVGSVVDAETGKPLDKFSVMQGIDFDDGRAPDWMIFEKRTVLTGQYAMDIRQETFQYRIRVWAEGYMPAESRLIKPYAPDKGRITLDFRLHQAPKLVGTVESLDKTTLANAEVFLVRGRMNIEDRRVTHIDSADRESVKTDPTGGFEFPPEVEPFCLIAVHRDGLGMVTQEQFAASPKITIRPWDQFKAQLQIVPRPAPGMSVDFPTP